jgi:tRNA nucleotidyltransferase (CCA-adding enzyme)
METINNTLPEHIYLFLQSMRNYIDKQVYYYGSVQRFDYLDGHSDIDLYIFTDNEKSTIYKLQHFLEFENNEIKKIIINFKKGFDVVYGYKVKYSNTEKNMNLEISIFDEKYRDTVLKHNETKEEKITPFVTIVLFILKYLYYKINLISKNAYSYLKRIIMTDMIGLQDDIFVKQRIVV